MCYDDNTIQQYCQTACKPVALLVIHVVWGKSTVESQGGVLDRSYQVIRYPFLFIRFSLNLLQDPTNELRLSLKRVIRRCPDLVRKNRKLAILSNGFSQRSPILLCFGKSLSVTCWRFKGQRSSPVFDGLHWSLAGFFYLRRKIVNIQYERETTKKPPVFAQIRTTCILTSYSRICLVPRSTERAAKNIWIWCKFWNSR